MKDDYTVAAVFYDGAYAADARLKDIPFYLDLAKRSGGPVLEVACGTGRILLPTARAGLRIDGLDASPAMLAVLKRRLAVELPEVRRRVRLHRGDMRRFDLGRRYRLVTIPFRPMQHMHTVDDQLAALSTARRHLAPGGHLAFNVFFPRMDLMDANLGRERPEFEWCQDGLRFTRTFTRLTHDKVAQHFTGRFIYRAYRGRRLVRTARSSLKMTYYTHPQLLLLFRMTGLEVVHQYGGFDRKPLDQDAREMVFVLRRRR